MQQQPGKTQKIFFKITGLCLGWIISLNIFLIFPSLKTFADETQKGAADLNRIDMSLVAIPIVHNNQARNYIITKLRVYVFRSSDRGGIKKFTPYVTDIITKLAARGTFSLNDDLNHVNVPLLEKMTLSAFTKYLGHNKVIKKIEVVEQTPKNVLPRPED